MSESYVQGPKRLRAARPDGGERGKCAFGRFGPREQPSSGELSARPFPGQPDISPLRNWNPAPARRESVEGRALRSPHARNRGGKRMDLPVRAPRFRRFRKKRSAFRTVRRGQLADRGAGCSGFPPRQSWNLALALVFGAEKRVSTSVTASFRALTIFRTSSSSHS